MLTIFYFLSIRISLLQNNFFLFYNNQKNNNNWNKFPLKISFNADEDHDDNANENSNWANDSEIDIKKSISLSQ